jgi:hypothetical protein
MFAIMPNLPGNASITGRMTARSLPSNAIGKAILVLRHGRMISPHFRLDCSGGGRSWHRCCFDEYLIIHGHRKESFCFFFQKEALSFLILRDACASTEQAVLF